MQYSMLGQLKKLMWACYTKWTRYYLLYTHSWHPPITPILPSCPLWEQFTRAGMVSLTSSKQLHCFFGALIWVASVADLKRLLSWFSPPAKVLRLTAITKRKLVTLVDLKCFFATYKEMLLNDPPIKTSMFKAFIWSCGSWVLYVVYMTVTPRSLCSAAQTKWRTSRIQRHTSDLAPDYGFTRPKIVFK